MLWCAVLWAAAVLVCSLTAYWVMFHPVCQSLDATREYGLSHGEFDEEILQRPWQDFVFESPGGALVRGQYLSAGERAPVAVFVHGIAWTRHGMLKYMKHFMERGWSVVMFDLPGHGESPAPRRRMYPSYGFFEKHDVLEGLRVVQKLFPHAPMTGLVGESLGAATALQCAPLAEEDASVRLDFVIADCSFSSAGEILLEQLRMVRIPNFIAWPSSRIVRLLAWLLRGFDICKASPMEAILTANTPIMLVHGMEDRYVPTMMSVRMASARMSRSGALTRLVLIPGARHAKSVMIGPDQWVQEAFAFIDEVAGKRQAASGNRRQ